MSDHWKQSEIIRSVHRRLRRSFKKDPESLSRIWSEHCENTDSLEEYASAMQKLATVHWKVEESNSRIAWCVNACREYFCNGGMAHAIKKDHFNKIAICEKADIPTAVPHQLPLDLLDVGSCYNPFSMHTELFKCTAIDLHPANESVLKCDFLSLCIVDKTMEPQQASTEVNTLCESSFDVVVFSLILEYLPSPQQRGQACLKTSRLLRPNGLLLIITPDSKHASYNYKLMRDWRSELVGMGLSRCRYDKLPHLHCMAFRKFGDAKEREYSIRIPQDDNTSDVLQETSPAYRRPVDEEIVDTFNALPWFDE